MKARKLFLAAMTVFAVFLFNSCEEDDPCKDVECGLYGICISGTCDCDAGYEGTECDSLSRAKFIGNYNYASTDSINCPQSGFTARIDTSAAGVDRIIFTNNPSGSSSQFYALVDETTLTFPNQDVMPTSIGIKIEGDGSYDASANPDKVTINIDLTDSAGNAISTCTFIYTKP